MTIDLKTSEPLFYVPELASLADTGILNTRESKHAGGARRLREGDAIIVFDGEGAVARCTIERLDPRGRSTSFAIVEREKFQEPAWRVGIAAGVPKGDRQNTLLDMCIQAGMTDYWPVLFERSVSKPDAPSERWLRIAVEACKQSRRPWLPRLHDPVGVSGLIDLAGSWQLHAADALESDKQLTVGLDQRLLIVGPEGGLTPEESNRLREAGALSLNLGPHILRTETAAVAGTVRLVSACTQVLTADPS